MLPNRALALAVATVAVASSVAAPAAARAQTVPRPRPVVSLSAGFSPHEFEGAGTGFTACVAAMNGASFEATYNFYIRLSFEKAYDAMLTTPIEADDVLLGETAWAVTRAMIYGTCFFLIVAAAGLAPLPGALAVIPVIAMTGLLFASLGLAFCVRAPSIELFSYYFTMFLTPLFLFSDVFFPLSERLSPFWQRVAEVLPLVHPVRLARAAFHGGVPTAVIAWDVVYIVGLSILLLAQTRRRLEKLLTS